MEQFTHGLIVVNPKQEGEMLDILHFVGYWKEPTQRDADDLREELKTDSEFGLMDMWDKVEILPAPEEIVEEYSKLIFEDEESNVLTTKDFQDIDLADEEKGLK